MTFSSPSWRSLSHSKGSLNHPKKVTKNCQVYIHILLELDPNISPSQQLPSKRSTVKAMSPGMVAFAPLMPRRDAYNDLWKDIMGRSGVGIRWGSGNLEHQPSKFNGFFVGEPGVGEVRFGRFWKLTRSCCLFVVLVETFLGEKNHKKLVERVGFDDKNM